MEPIQVLINQKAGSLWGRDNTSLTDILTQLNQPYQVHQPASYEKFEELLANWQANPPRRIVIAGGDGTISTVWKYLLGKEVVYGLIPRGSLNNIATRLGIPTDPGEAIDIINHGQISRVDAGKANGKPFFESVGTGLMANIMHKIGDQDTKKEVGKIAKVTLKELFDHDVLTVQVVVDGQTRIITTPWLTVSNLGTIGAALVDPEADAEARKLSLVYCRELDATEMAKAALQFAKSQHLDGEYFTSIECSDVTVTTVQPAIFHRDDEVVRTSKLKVSVLPGVLSVLRPYEAH